jgi:hypothetical protein
LRHRTENIPPSARDRLKLIWLDTVDDAVTATIGLGNTQNEE